MLLLLLEDFRETSLVLLDWDESRDEFGVRKVWRRRRLWRGRWRVMLVLCPGRNERGVFNECGVGTYYCCRVVLARQDIFTSKTTGLLGPYGFMEISVDGYDDPPNGRHRSGQKRWFAPGNPRAARLWLSSVYQVPKFVYE
jgi:hypothetical protein